MTRNSELQLQVHVSSMKCTSAMSVTWALGAFWTLRAKSRTASFPKMVGRIERSGRCWTFVVVRPPNYPLSFLSAGRRFPGCLKLRPSWLALGCRPNLRRKPGRGHRHCESWTAATAFVLAKVVGARCGVAHSAACRELAASWLPAVGEICGWPKGGSAT